jgi:hypothetical protein
MRGAGVKRFRDCMARPVALRTGRLHRGLDTYTLVPQPTRGTRSCLLQNRARSYGYAWHDFLPV